MHLMEIPLGVSLERELAQPSPQVKPKLLGVREANWPPSRGVLRDQERHTGSRPRQRLPSHLPSEQPCWKVRFSLIYETYCLSGSSW